MTYMASGYDTISKAHLAAARSIDQLRRQLAIVLKEQTGAVCGGYPIEGIAQNSFAALRALPNVRLSLLIRGARARHAGITTKEPFVRIDAQNLSLDDLWALSDPLSKAPAPKSPALLPVTPMHDMLLSMAKYASLLPAMLVIENTIFPPDWLTIDMNDVATYWNSPPLEIVPLVSAKLPIHHTENATLTCFRGRFGTSTHLALTIGDLAANEAPLTRVHSSCVTGDILGSLRCDCGDQLHMALEQITAHGSGILLYLHQEGRGIGIANKLRAYALQEKGVDTYEANLMLGFDEDERDFSIAAGILKKMSVNAITMLTNNPHKMKRLEQKGIKVVSRVPLVAQSGKHSHDYISAKAKAGHQF